MSVSFFPKRMFFFFFFFCDLTDAFRLSQFPSLTHQPQCVLEPRRVMCQDLKSVPRAAPSIDLLQSSSVSQGTTGEKQASGSGGVCEGWHDAWKESHETVVLLGISREPQRV